FGGSMIKVGVIGATGYTGLELIRLLVHHPQVNLCFATSKSRAGERLPAVFPSAPDVPLIDPAEAPLKDTQVVFLCLPHAESAQVAVQALAAGVRVGDLSADFRLRDAKNYQKWYVVEQPATELQQEAVYGLTEAVRADLPGARLVANPGCYPTSVLLALKPLLDENAIHSTVIVDSKSGVSGAGRKPKLTTQFVEVDGNLSPYNVGRTHRHLPEMEQAAAWWSDDAPALIFSPHLVPAPRGLLSTIYVHLDSNWNEKIVRQLYDRAYGNEAFIHVLSQGETATYAHVNYTNRCAIGLTLTEGVLILTSAIDNLIKGASGQAVQNMNAMFGIDETAGLPD
ncbi:MAG: N-acetyl-gamma-glutamyl-phosphate reductase, partial [Anaerolineales bacterium]